jgi:hypothetical protein
MCDYAKLRLDDLLAIANQFGIDVPDNREQIIEIFKDYKICPEKSNVLNIQLELFEIRGETVYRQLLRASYEPETLANMLKQYGFARIKYKQNELIRKEIQKNLSQYNPINYEYSRGFQKVIGFIEDYILDIETIQTILFGQESEHDLESDDLIARVAQLVHAVKPGKIINQQIIRTNLLKSRNFSSILNTSETISSEIFMYLTRLTCKSDDSCDRCRGSILILYFHGIPVGFIFLFHESESKILNIQSITNTWPSIIAKYLFPELELPRLNDYFIPYVIQYAKNLDCQAIHVYPIGSKQQKILITHYGFKTDFSPTTRCGNLSFINSLKFELGETHTKL